MSTPTLSPLLRRLLVSTLLLSALALWWPPSPMPTVLSSGPVDTVQSQVPPSSAAVATERKRLPVELPTPEFTPAQFDPFIGVAAIAPPIAKPVIAAAQMPVAISVPTAPKPPPMNYRYLGQMVDPSGRSWVYLARAEATFPVVAGTRLDDGYVVQAIEADAVHLHHAATNINAIIPVPLPAKEVLSR